MPDSHLDCDGPRQCIAEFLTVFADKCHHGKEEDLLFPAMEAVGVRREGGPIGVMLTELAEAFEQLERERVGPGKHEEFHRLLNHLKRTYLFPTTSKLCTGP